MTISALLRTMLIVRVRLRSARELTWSLLKKTNGVALPPLGILLPPPRLAEHNWYHDGMLNGFAGSEWSFEYRRQLLLNASVGYCGDALKLSSGGIPSGQRKTLLPWNSVAVTETFALGALM